METTKLNINFTVLSKETLNSRLKSEGRQTATPAYSQASKSAQAAKSKEATTEKPELLTHKAFFAVDENNNIVIKVVDSDGKLIRQMPPEEYIKMAEALKEITKNIFHTEA